MTDRTADITGSFDTTAKLLKLTDNGDDTVSVSVSLATALVPKVYDYIALSYTGDNLTGVVYKTGGSGGTTVATLTLAYSGSTLTSITRT